MKKKFKNQLFNHYKWWDHYYLLDMMEDWLRHASHKHQRYGNLLRSEETSKKMLIAANLIKRIKDDEVYSCPNKVFTKRNGCVKAGVLFEEDFVPFEYCLESDEKRKEDLKYLFKFLEKSLFGFWD